MNVLICTPGRLLQHMEESVGFNADNLQMLVLDEADMILEMGFANTLKAILQNLPQEKQTMLFSATLSKNIQELGRLSLKVCFVCENAYQCIKYRLQNSFFCMWLTRRKLMKKKTNRTQTSASCTSYPINLSSST